MKKLTTTFFPKWAKVIFFTTLSIVTIGSVALFGLLAHELVHLRGSIYNEFYISLIWCAAELALIYHIFSSSVAPLYVQVASSLVVLLGNAWFLSYAIQLYTKST